MVSTTCVILTNEASKSALDYIAGDNEMAEGTTHLRVKAKAAGKSGRTEIRISGNRRLDAVTRSKAVEVEISGQPKRLEMAARRLKASGKENLLLVVPQKDMNKARLAIKAVRTRGTVRNLSGTKYSSVLGKSALQKGTNSRASGRKRATRKR